MMHSSQGFAEHMLGLLKKTGPSGPTGPTPNKPFKSNEKAGTTQCAEVGPVDLDWSQDLRATGPGKMAINQSLAEPGTTGTGGTTIFEQGPTQRPTGTSPSEWHAILAALNQQNCPDWLSPNRWNMLLSDAEIFLERWGAAAHSLGWTPLDLFGVHPIVPAARFDVMGLIPILQGGEVIALTDRAATFRRSSGAVLTYRRSDQAAAICITQVTG